MNAPSKMIELSEDTREWLSTLREDELETLKAVVELPAQDVREGFKMARDLRAVSRFMRWLIISMVALFAGTVMLYENVLKVIGWMKGGPH